MFRSVCIRPSIRELIRALGKTEDVVRSPIVQLLLVNVLLAVLAVTTILHGPLLPTLVGACGTAVLIYAVDRGVNRLARGRPPISRDRSAPGRRRAHPKRRVVKTLSGAREIVAKLLTRPRYYAAAVH